MSTIVKNASEYTESELASLISLAKLTYDSIEPNPIAYVACGRVYLCFGKIRAGSKTMKALETLGVKFTSRPGYSFKVGYMGYDNATGRLLQKAERLAKALRQVGVDVYADSDMD